VDTDRIKYKDKKCEYGDLNWKALMDPHLNLWWTLDRSVRQNVADNGLVEYKLNIIYIYIYLLGDPTVGQRFSRYRLIHVQYYRSWYGIHTQYTVASRPSGMNINQSLPLWFCPH